jgi:ribosome-binding factor A
VSHPYARSRRVADLIRRELADILLREAQDPRFKQLTISQVQLSRDLSFAKIYVTGLDPYEAKEVVYSLNRASGFFRHTLANSVNMRGTPKLRFYVDSREQHSQHIENLISESKQQLIDYSDEFSGYNDYDEIENSE